jgi:hypothetical protein
MQEGGRRAARQRATSERAGAAGPGPRAWAATATRGQIQKIIQLPLGWA